jgi:alpha-1,6-mannosyltransferase
MAGCRRARFAGSFNVTSFGIPRRSRHPMGVNASPPSAAADATAAAAVGGGVFDADGAVALKGADGVGGGQIVIAGSISLVAWSGLAWISQTPLAPLGWMLVTMAITWAALAWALRRAVHAPAAMVVGFAIAFRFVAAWASPIMEDDHHRFLWDGYRFATTGDPYATAPQAHFHDETVTPKFRAVLDRINHPDVRTVYGPLTQWAFRLSHALAPAQLWPWKLLLMGAELAMLAMLWPVLPARGRLLFAWCPLAIFETGFNVHPDILALALLIAAWWLGRKSCFFAAGMAAGLAVAAKVFAVLLVPFVLWRLGRRAWAAASAGLFALYAPFWVRGSAADLDGLRAMAGEWEFNSSIFAIVQAVATREVAQVACAVGFGLVWLWLFRRWVKQAAPCAVLPPGEWVYGAFLLLSATANPWYFLWLWPFVALRISAVGVTALAAVSLAYMTGLNLGDTAVPPLGNFAHPWWVRPLEFGAVFFAGLVSYRHVLRNRREAIASIQER